MKKVHMVFVVLIIIATGLGAISVWIFLQEPPKYFEDFENGLGAWVVDAEVPEDPNNPGQSIEWHITRVSNVSRSNSFSLELFIDGRQDDGTVWIETKIELKKPSQIKVAFWLYSEQQSSNTRAAVCVYVGTKNPETEMDFYVLGAADEIAGWKNYEYSTVIDASGEAWVAVGISVRWEAYLTYYLDDLKIEVS